MSSCRAASRRVIIVPTLTGGEATDETGPDQTSVFSKQIEFGSASTYGS
jgi:hypothetical protein